MSSLVEDYRAALDAQILNILDGNCVLCPKKYEEGHIGIRYRHAVDSHMHYLTETDPVACLQGKCRQTKKADFGSEGAVSEGAQSKKIVRFDLGGSLTFQ